MRQYRKVLSLSLSVTQANLLVKDLRFDFSLTGRHLVKILVFSTSLLFQYRLYLHRVYTHHVFTKNHDSDDSLSAKAFGSDDDETKYESNCFHGK